MKILVAIATVVSMLTIIAALRGYALELEVRYHEDRRIDELRKQGIL